jgi:hypothetical protein
VGGLGGQAYSAGLYSESAVLMLRSTISRGSAIAGTGGGDGSDIGAFEFIPTPRLTIQPAANNNVLLSWSTNAADFHLLTAPNLAAPGTWTEVTDTRVIAGNQVYVTNSAAGTRQSYRLNLPPPNQPPP